MWFEVPITARLALSRSVGRPAIHSSISTHDGVRPRSDGLNQVRRPHQSRRATALVELASVRGRGSRRDLVVETTDLSVSQPVVHEGELLSGDGDTGLVLAPTLAMRR